METSQETTIELTGIGTGMNDGMLMNMYRTYGPILRVAHNRSNSAQVVFEQKNHARQAVEATDGAVVYGKKLRARVQRQFTKSNQSCHGFAAGICRKGDMCKYQHVTDTAAFTPSTVKKAKREHKKKTPKAAEPVVSPKIQVIPGKQVCRHFSRGYCSQDAECGFAHVLGLAKPTETASTEKTTRPCLFFQSGVCTRGDACRFAHVPKAAAPVKTEAKETPAKQPVDKKAPARKAVAKKTPAKKAVVQASDDEGEVEPEQSGETRTCVECEKPGVAVWKCAKCDNSLYCDGCNSAVHSARVMAKHNRAKLPPVPTLPRCGECESKTASVRCEQCEVLFCASCDASVHKFKSLRNHVRVKMFAKSEKAKPTPAKEKEEKIKQEVESPPLLRVANHVSYVKSVPQTAFSSDSESEDEAMPEASPAHTRKSVDDDDTPMPAAAGSSDTETEGDFDDVKVPVTPNPVVEEQASESESDEDFDDKPATVPASVPKTELSSDSDSSDDELEEPTRAANPAPKMELSSDSESEDDSEDEAPAKPASKPVSTPASKPTLAELSSESDDSDDENSPKPVVKSTPKPAKNVSESSDDSDDEAPPKPVVKKTPSKSSSSDSSRSDSSDSEDEAPPAKPAAKTAPTPAPYRAPAPARNNKIPGISNGSSHTLVKKIEAFNQSGEGHEMHLNANLNGFERLLAHDCAERLGLEHESVGAGLERHIIISRHGSKRPATDSSSGHKAKKSKHQ